MINIKRLIDAIYKEDGELELTPYMLNTVNQQHLTKFAMPSPDDHFTTSKLINMYLAFCYKVIKQGLKREPQYVDLARCYSGNSCNGYRNVDDHAYKNAIASLSES